MRCILLSEYITCTLLLAKYCMTFFQSILQYGLHFILVYYKIMACFCASCIEIFMSWYLQMLV